MPNGGIETLRLRFDFSSLGMRTSILAKLATEELTERAAFDGKDWLGFCAFMILTGCFSLSR